MSAINSAMSLVADYSIRTKVAMGFLCVMVVLTAISGVTYFSFQTSAEGFSTYIQRVLVVGIARDVDRGFMSLRRIVRNYASTADESAVEAAGKEQASLRLLLQRGAAEIKNPERRHLIAGIAENFEIYSKDFDQVVTQTRDQKKLFTSTLEPLGESLFQQLNVLIAAAAKAGDGNVQILANEGVKLLLQARLNINKEIAWNDKMAGEAAESLFADFLAVLQVVDAATKDVRFRNAFDGLPAGAITYRDAYRRILDLDQTIDAMVNKQMSSIAQQVQTDAESIKASGIADEQQEEHDTLSTMSRTSSLILYLSIAGLLTGAVLSWLTGRGISRPVIAMCTAMRALAGGNKTLQVPGLGRRDEIGQMADAVQVFKDNMVETDRLRDEQEQIKARAEVERKATMNNLADSFEAGVKGVVNGVAAQATEMEASAKAMTHTAEQATRQATAVAAAVEQASANVQTVASSAEELSASVLEIGRQVEQSSKIAGQAVSEADRTNTIVEGLNRTAQRIGEVVQLIESIAGQTNLLALNATIEAARAGDAGKGFAVVASEVKSLASQTAKATEDIKAQINSIQGATTQTVGAIHGIGETIRQMNEIATTIASAVEEQGAATREIATNVQQAAQGTGDIANNIGGVSQAAAETGASAAQVLAAAGELSRQSETLRHDVDTFVATVRAA